MPEHDTKFSLNRHAKRRRVDIGVKRTVSSAATLTQTASGIITANPTVMNGIRKQDVLESQAAKLGHSDMGVIRSNNVLRKLLKRTSSYGDDMVPFHSAAIISNLLKRNMSKGGGDQGITESKASQEDTCSTSSQDSPQECPSPSANATLYPFDSDRLNDEHLRAKRARVENIIRGMSHSPNMTAPLIPRVNDRGQNEDGETEGPPQSRSPRDNYRENKRKQKLPQQQHRSYQQLVSAHKEQKVEERRQLKLQLEDMQKQLRQLQEKLFQMYDSTDSEADGGNISEDSVRSDEGLVDGDLNEDSRSNNDLDPGQFLDQARALLGEQVLSVREKPKRESYLRGKDLISMHEEGKHLAETLKQELNSAMSQVVETVVKIFAKSRRTTQDYIAGNGDNPDFHSAHQRVQCLADVINPSPLESFGGAPLPSANHQTEAMSLVVRKSPFEHHQSSALGADGGHPHPSLHPSSLSANMTFSSPSFRHPFPLSLMAYSFQSAFGAPSAGYSRKDQNFPDSMDLSRESIGMPTKMSSGHHLGHHRSCSPVQPGSTAEGPSLSFIKSECGDLQDMSDISTYSGSTVQEGLSPNHLKKAKVMFFYSRYPSSNTLKMYFPDVKFNRCITSQLIKWFSNFREFFYIQMEKFARQAINDGVLTADDLSVTCDSELYRVLNMHYNKSNDFQVPERFLEVAQITLREFFNAIVSGKDVDPSWKKAIYKVICKLDSEVPEIFKSKKCLLKLLHE
ncbi:prospero homeobox protein 1-like [Triplophysa dalaica]|uniref:prospero homeobox protein 1-like n=1 Tax=Triplophysa dalaica TaxID=1582913 RepID=UPI0024E00AFF|nr:prospero homeobox protein 1-like [Triplophysa dalaica]XP_056620232.1 prospero homeobox protein 1-like [Triplophysa dalaica]